ncbi:Ulp1 protease family, carboxy-terminal domain protein [Arachis hypogaea]|nr:Ulp1 protease family, carboxy-terminal domain protein [Arachis hypogaea]
MVFADNLLKIYVPLHMGRHWYLMIVDMWNQNLIYLDSLKSSNERQARIDQILKVARLLELLLSDKLAYESKTTVPKCISKFRIHEPHISQQVVDSVDDPIRFMGIEVNDTTRMTIAIDLVTGDHNPISEEVQQKAVQFWDRNMIGSYMKGVRPRKRTRSPAGVPKLHVDHMTIFLGV